MRAMVLKGTLEEYELATVQDIPANLCAEAVVYDLGVEFFISHVQQLPTRETVVESVRDKLPIYSKDTEMCDCSFDEADGGGGTKVTVELKQTRYFVEINQANVKFGELVLTQQFGYCLLLDIEAVIEIPRWEFEYKIPYMSLAFWDKPGSSHTITKHGIAYYKGVTYDGSDE